MHTSTVNCTVDVSHNVGFPNIFGKCSPETFQPSCRIYEGSVFSPLTAALTDKLVTNKLVTKCLKAGRLVNRTSFWNNA